MLKAMHFHDGKSERIKPGAKARSGLVWLDCEAPTKEEIRSLAKFYSVDPSELEDALDKNERARLRANGTYHFIIFKRPLIKEESFRTGSIGILWTGNTVVTVHRKHIKELTELAHTNHKTIEHPVGFIQAVLSALTDSYFKALETIGDDLEKLEEKVVTPSPKTHTANILKLRKTLIYFQKSLLANREVLHTIAEGNAFVLNKQSTHSFRSLYNDNLQLLDLTGIYSEVLSSILETDLASTNTALGDVMKKLTVIASFALVPTLIASIYGMNFRPNSPWNMPELDWFLGYPFSLGLMVASILGMYIYFKKQEWL